MSNPIPGLLALTSITDGSQRVAAPIRNNFSAIQTAENEIITALGGGSAGQVLNAVDTTHVQWAFPPGYQFDYAEIIANATSTQVSAAAATAVITGSAVTYDGATAIWVELVAPAGGWHSIANTAAVIELYDGATDLGILGRMISPATNQGPAVRSARKITPSAGVHTYSLRLWGGGAGTATLSAGPGGLSADLPAAMRITKA